MNATRPNIRDANFQVSMSSSICGGIGSVVGFRANRKAPILGRGDSDLLRTQIILWSVRNGSKIRNSGSALSLKSTALAQLHSEPETGFMPKRPRDPNQLAKLIVDIATGQVEDTVSTKKRMSVRGRSGGLKGGNVRARLLTQEQRIDIARLAAQARWKKKPTSSKD